MTRNTLHRILWTLLLTGCGVKDTLVTRPDTIVFASGESSVEKGGRLSLGVTLTGTPIPTLRSCTSSDPAVLQASLSGSECALTGVEAGSATVTASSSSGKTVQRQITVIGLPALVGRPSVRVPATMFVSDTGSAIVTATRSDGSVSVNIDFGSLTPSVVSVSASGAITAVGAGSGTVRAIVSATGPRHARSVDTLLASVAVSSQQPGLTSVRLTLPGDTALTIGVAKALQATVQGPLNATARLTFGSVTPTIATVDTAGRASGVLPGIARLWVRAQSASTGPFAGNAVADTLTVRVAALLPPFQDVQLPNIPDLYPGEQASIAPTITPTPGTPLTPTLVTTYVVSNPTVITISAGGLITAVSPGTVSISVTVRGGGPGFSDSTVTRTANVRVLPPAPGLTSLTVAPTSLALAIGGTATLTPAVTGPMAASATVTYGTSAPAIAVSSGSGVVTARGPGTAVLTVFASTPSTGRYAATTLTATVPVTVAGSITAIRINAPSTRVRTLATLPLAVTVTASPNVNAAVTWLSRNTAVATVSSDGVVSGVAEGSTWIVATAVLDPAIRDSIQMSVVLPCDDTPAIDFNTVVTATFSSRSCLEANALRERFRFTTTATTMVRAVLQSSTLPVSLTPVLTKSANSYWDSPVVVAGDYLTAVVPAGDWLVGVNSTVQPNVSNIMVERGFVDRCDPVVIASGVSNYTLRLFTTECTVRPVHGVNAFVRNLYLLPALNTGQTLRIQATSAQFRVHIDLYNSSNGNLVDSVTAPGVGGQAEARVTSTVIGEYYYAVLSNRASPNQGGAVTVTILGPPFPPTPSASRAGQPARAAASAVPGTLRPATLPAVTRTQPPRDR